MTISIAFAGKGGTGKTTLAGLLVKYLAQTEKGPILAVDADSNANLNEVLGLSVRETLGEAREQMKTVASNGMTKDLFIEMKIQEAVVESKGFDLIVMGRPEGPGCYCAANTLLTQFLDKLIDNYPYVVIDNEAGMEHISRLTTNNVDILLAVSDSSRRGIQAAARIIELTSDLKLDIKHQYLIINIAKKGQDEVLRAQAEKYGLDLIGIVPEDEKIHEYDLEGRPTVELKNDAEALNAAFAIFDKIFKK
jgi:CO dehydrogenase maturation factor